MECECGGKMEKIKTSLKGFEVRGWRCSKCKEILIHPVDADIVNNILNTKKKNKLKVKLRTVGKSKVVTVPHIFMEKLNLKEGMKLEWDFKDGKLFLKI